MLIAALFLLSLLTYIDRAAISSAKAPIAADLGLSDQSMGAVFSAFALGYALAQIPSGWLADRMGPRIALTAVVALWSLFTALTGAAAGFASLLAARFIFGVAEAGAFPGAARAFHNWLPVERRGLANGIIFSGSRLGAAVAFPVMTSLFGIFGWRGSFVVLGAVTAAWAVFWAVWFRDYPPGHAPEPVETGPQGPSFGAIFRSKALVLAMAQYFASNFTFFLCLSWMHPYLKEHYRLAPSEAAAYAMAPLVFGASSQWISGFLVDRLYRGPRRVWSRRLPAIAGLALSCVGLLALTRASTPLEAAICFTAATFGTEMTISPSWVYCMDIGGKRSGAVSASMNMVGNIGSFVSANAFPFLYGLTGSASTYFLTAAALNAMGAVCWWRMTSLTPSPSRSPGG